MSIPTRALHLFLPMRSHVTFHQNIRRPCRQQGEPGERVREASTRSKSNTQQVSKCRASLKKGKEKAIKLHKQGASKQEAEEEAKEEEDEAIARSKSYTQQVPKYRRKSKKAKQAQKRKRRKQSSGTSKKQQKGERVREEGTRGARGKRKDCHGVLALPKGAFDRSCAERKPAARGRKKDGN